MKYFKVKKNGIIYWFPVGSSVDFDMEYLTALNYKALMVYDTNEDKLIKCAFLPGYIDKLTNERAVDHYLSLREPPKPKFIDIANDYIKAYFEHKEAGTL